MSSNVVAKAAAGGVVAVSKKYTVQSAGIWEKLRRALAVDPERSTGVPLNPQFRNPPPGALDPITYSDPVTVPAGDIADNAYWMRDVRRNYPQTSVLAQRDVAALLRLGSRESPRAELIGDAGQRALVVAREDKDGTALVEAIDGRARMEPGKEGEDMLFVDGLPPTPSGQSLAAGSWQVHAYELTDEQSYPRGDYPCRSFR